MVTNKTKVYPIAGVKAKYGSYDTFSVPELANQISNVKNLSVISDGDNQLELKGSYFIIDLSNFNYYHFLHSQVGQYELLKRYIDNLKPLFIIANNVLKLNIRNMLPVLDILDLYGLSEKDIIVYSETGFMVEDIYFYDSRSSLLHEIFDVTDVNVMSETQPDFIAYTIEIAKILNKRFDSYMSREQTKKTYLIDGGAVDNEDELIRWAKSKGFNVVDPYKLTLFQQIAMASSSKVIAGINGSSLTNIMFARPGTTVIIFDPLPNFSWYHYQISQALGLTPKRMICEIPGVATFKQYDRKDLI